MSCCNFFVFIIKFGVHFCKMTCLTGEFAHETNDFVSKTFLLFRGYCCWYKFIAIHSCCAGHGHQQEKRKNRNQAHVLYFKKTCQLIAYQLASPTFKLKRQLIHFVYWIKFGPTGSPICSTKSTAELYFIKESVS